jgi:peptide/nickel transport system permease protein
MNSSKRRLFRRFCHRRLAVLGLVLLFVVVLVALLAPVVYPIDAAEMIAPPLLWPGQSAAFPLGSDQLGRDIAAGLAHGARTALLIGIASTGTAMSIGVVVGAFCGYYAGRFVEIALMRLIELFQTMPQFILVLVMVALFSPSLVVTITSIAAVSWPPVARLVRAEVMSLREREFVQAAVALGRRDAGIIFVEILPNCLAPIIVTSSIMVASAILTEAGLSFLGLGDPNLITWGGMIGEGRNNMRTAWYLVAEPGAALLLTIVSLSLVAEGLNDALNVRWPGRPLA